MADEFPKVTRRSVTKVSPWVDIVARDVVFAAGEAPQTYHALGQQDYLAIVALTPDRRIPLVRQYRPAVERVTLELPAGLVEPGEDPAASCARELLEETGFSAKAVHAIGAAIPCSARMSNRIHSFFVETGERDPAFKPEAGLAVSLHSLPEIAELIRSGEFDHQLQLGALMLAELHGHLTLPR
ncbi:MAG: NUDIX hydrolase [Pseudolabrys sp.]